MDAHERHLPTGVQMKRCFDAATKKPAEASLVDQLADALRELYLRPFDDAAIKRAELALEAYNSR